MVAFVAIVTVADMDDEGAEDDDDDDVARICVVIGARSRSSWRGGSNDLVEVGVSGEIADNDERLGSEEVDIFEDVEGCSK